MAKEIKVDNFWSGCLNDIRSTLSSGFWYSENLEVGKNKSLKQVVNNQAENVCSYATANNVTKLIQVGTQIYGLGQDNVTNKDTTIWTKTNALNGNWAIPSNGTIAATTFNADNPLFVACNGVIYFDGGNSKVATYTIATTTMAATAINLASAKGGVVWQGNIYCWSGQDIYVINTTTLAVTNMKSVSTEQTIVELVPYGNLLAVVCTSTVTTSKMYLWDGVSTTTWVDIVEIGVGTVSGGALLEGSIIVAISTPNKRTLKLKGYNGGQFRNLFTYTGRYNQAGTYNYVIPASKLKTFTGFVYFIITGTKPDGTYAGLYEYSIVRFGREEPINPMTFSVYKTLDFTSARTVDGAVTKNDFTIIESIVGGSDTAERSIAATINSATDNTTFFLSSTNTYTAQAGVVETVKYNFGDSAKEKSFKMSVQFSPLPTAGQVVLKYKKDEETTWTTMFTETTDNAVYHECVNIESTGVELPIFKEIQFRFEMIGGAELTGYRILASELNGTIDQ